MKKLTSVFFAFLLHVIAPAQDQLFKTDNSKILVKVLEVGPDDIKYKLFNEPNGPVYIESKKNVALIIYQSGEHQILRQGGALPTEVVRESRPRNLTTPLTRSDSTIYYQYENALSMNFLYFFNNELGFTYRREFFDKKFNVVIPFGFGISAPNVTQSIYFDDNTAYIEIHKKNFEAGIGVNYYPSLKTRNNYYIGPVFRYMQYDVTQEAASWPTYLLAANNTVLSRYGFSITNGLICRTKSRLTINMFTSIGFKSDQIRDPLRDQAGNVIITIDKPLSLYWWGGFEIGFSF